MNKTELKKYLDDYWFDNQYITQKIKELEDTKKRNDKILDLSLLSNNIHASTLYQESQQQEENRLKELLSKKQQIEENIGKLSQPYKTIMYFRYICFLNFDQIADKTNYSTKRIYQLHSEGLLKLLDIYNEAIVASK